MKKIFKKSFLVISVLLLSTLANAQKLMPNKVKGCAPEVGINFDIVPAAPGNNVIDFGNGQLVSITSSTGISTAFLVPGSLLVQLYTNTGTVSNPVKGIFIDSVRVLISQKPDVTFTASNTMGCAMLATSFTKTVVTYGSPVFSTTWVFGDGDASNSVANTITHNYPALCPTGAKYTPSLTVVDGNGCINSFALATPVSVSCKPKIKLTPASPYASCTSPKTYAFDASGSTSGSPNGAGSTLTFDWKLKTGIVGTPPKIKLASDTFTQTYTTGAYDNFVIATDDNGCKDSLYFAVSIGNPVITKYNIPDTVCANTIVDIYDSIKVTNSRTWIMNMGNGQFFSPSPSNKYFSWDDTCGVFKVKLTAKNGNGCQDTISKRIVVQRIKLSFKLIPSYICEMPRGKPIKIKIKNTTNFCGGTDAQYKWEVYDTSYVREVDGKAPHPWYKLVPKINIGAVHYPFHIIGASTGPGPVLPGSQPNTPYVTTTSNTAQDAEFELQWLDTNQYATNNYMGYLHNTLLGKIKLSAKSNTGCVADPLISSFVDTIDLVESFFTMNDHYGCAPLTINFKDSSFSSTALKDSVTGAPIYPINQWSWNFDDGTTLDPNKNPSHTFTTPGIYNVRLAVKNTLGCRDTSYAIQIQVGDKPVPSFTVTPPSCHDATVNFADATTFPVSDPNNTSYSYYASSPNLAQGFPSPTYANGPFNANSQAMSNCFMSPLSSYKFENIAGPLTIGMKVCVRGCCDKVSQTINISGPLVRLRASLSNQGDSTFKCATVYHKTNLDSTTYIEGDYRNYKFSAHIQDGDKISMDWTGDGTFDSTFTVVNSTTNHFFNYNHSYGTNGVFKAFIKVENTLNGCPPSYDTVVVFPNYARLNGYLKNFKDTVMCQTDPGKANAVDFVANTVGVNWNNINALSWDWDEERFNTFNDAGNPVVLEDLSQGPLQSNNKADTLANHAFVNWDRHLIVVTIRDINNCVLRDTIHLKINGISPKIQLADRNFVNGKQYMCQFDTMHLVNLSTSSSKITDWYWGVYEEKPVPNTNPTQYTYTAPGAPPVYYPNPSLYNYNNQSYYQYNLPLTPNPPGYPYPVISPWGQHIGNPAIDGDLRKDTAITIIKDTWPKQFPLVIIYQMINADGCYKTVNNWRWEQIQNAPELGPQPFTSKTFCLTDTLLYKIKLSGTKAEIDSIRANKNKYVFKWSWGDGKKDTTHTFDTIKHRYDYVQQAKYAPDYLKAAYKFQLSITSPEGCKKVIKIVPTGNPPTDSVYVYRKPENGILTVPSFPIGDTAVFCYNTNSLNVIKPKYKWFDKKITYHWAYSNNIYPVLDTVRSVRKSPADSILYLPDSLHIGLQFATLYTSIDGVPGCNSDTAIVNFKINGVRGDFKLNDTLICLGNELQLDTLKARDVKSWKIIWGDNASDSTNVNPKKHTYNAGTSNGQYTVAVKFYNGICTDTKIKKIYVEDIKSLFLRNGETATAITLKDTAHCIGIEDNLTNNSSVVPLGRPITYTWLLGNGTTAGTTNTLVKYPTDGTYTVMLIAKDNVKGCVDTLKKTIVVHPTPDVNFTVTDTCYDDVLGKSKPIRLNATGGGAGATYNWYVYNTGNTTVIDSIKNPLNDSTAVIEIANSNPKHTFFLEVTNKFGCKDTISKTAYVFTKPLGKVFNDTILIGETDTLNASLTNPNGYNYTWTPTTDLDCANCPQVVSSTLEDITYTLNYADKAGCFTVQNIYNIKVDPLTTMDVPTAFTPNADGTNDIVYVDGRGIKQLNYFKIYNRWGELVFETTNLSEGWDGTFKGQKQPIETYVWQAEVLTYVKDTNNNKIFKKGIIKLFR
jgi:gliding motility-associated-like protein